MAKNQQILEGIGVVLIPILIIVLIWGCDMVVSIHAISTREAPGFSEEKFRLIEVGMTARDVIAVLGRPLSEEPKPPGLVEWWYTEPKEPLDGWGTWDARIILFSNRVVVKIESQSWPNH